MELHKINGLRAYIATALRCAKMLLDRFIPAQRRQARAVPEFQEVQAAQSRRRRATSSCAAGHQPGRRAAPLPFEGV